MTSARHQLPRAAAIGLRTSVATAGIVIAAIVALVILRSRQAHPAPLYPDGYQYLLMARGLAEHGRPLLQLGDGGDLLAPSADAGLKPFYPALVALVSYFGVSVSTAARILGVLASAALVPLVGLFSQRVCASRSAGLAAATVVAGSPAFAFWSGFSGPDALALCLAGGGGLALCRGRSSLGGALVGLCLTTRPELGLIVVAGFAAALSLQSARSRTRHVMAATALTTAVVYGAVRPPLSVPSVGLLAAGLCAAGLLGFFAAWAIRWRERAAGVLPALGASAAATAFVATRSGEAWTAVTKTDGALFAFAIVATGLGLCRRETRAASSCTLIAFAGLAMVYADKNPSSVRYVSLLIPILALLIGAGVAALPRLTRRAGAGAVATCALATALVASTPSVGSDMFPAVAHRLSNLPPGPIITAAPDAYGVLLRSRTIRVMREGRRGLILVDGVARAYEPTLAARGAIVARIPTTVGFLRPDGHLDRAPAFVVDGVVTRRRAPGARGVTSTPNGASRLPHH